MNRISDQEVKDRCVWAHKKYKERMSAISENQYHIPNEGCALHNITTGALKFCNVHMDCRQCIAAKQYNARLAILLSNY